MCSGLKQVSINAIELGFLRALCAANAAQAAGK
jgi:hypothetical protein